MITSDELQLYGIDPRLLNIFKSKFPNGASAEECFKQIDIPIELSFFIKRYIRLTDEEIRCYNEALDISDSSDVYDSSNVFHSHKVFDSSHISNSSSIYDSVQVERSNDIHDSYIVKDSECIFRSNSIDYGRWIVRSADVSYSEGIVDSRNINVSHFILDSEDVNSSSLVVYGKNSTELHCCNRVQDSQSCLFCNGISGAEYCIFNQPVEPEQWWEWSNLFLSWETDNIVKNEESLHLFRAPMVKFHLLSGSKGFISLAPLYNGAIEPIEMFAQRFPNYNAELLSEILAE